MFNKGEEITMGMLINLGWQFIEYGCGFKTDEAIDKIHLQINENDPFKLKDFKIQQVIRKALFVTSGLMVTGLGTRLISQLFFSSLPTLQSKLEKYLPIKILITVFIISTLAWLILRNFIQKEVYSKWAALLLNHPQPVAEEQWDDFCHHGQFVQSVHLIGKNHVPMDYEKMQKFTKVCSNLKSFQIDASNLSEKSIAVLSYNCPNLKHLELFRSHLNNKDFQYLKGLDYLSTLMIESSRYLTDTSVFKDLIIRLSSLHLDMPIRRHTLHELANITKKSRLFDLRIYSPHFSADDLAVFCYNNYSRIEKIGCLQDDTIKTLHQNLNQWKRSSGYWQINHDLKGALLKYEDYSDSDDD